MSEQFVEQAKANMGAIERLLKGLPGIQGYTDKELRRDADKRLRDLLAAQLAEQKQHLLAVQQRLLQSGGLRWLDDVDQVVQKVQILIDRIRTASYGYAGLFDAVRIREEQLAALHRFDEALAGQIAEIAKSINQLTGAVATVATDSTAFQQALNQLLDQVVAMDLLFNRRHNAVLSPDLLTDTHDLPTVQ
ncbi:MAG: hypothetical protein R3C14_07945 [Caldilineaceae bacterium]